MEAHPNHLAGDLVDRLFFDLSVDWSMGCGGMCEKHMWVLTKVMCLETIWWQSLENSVADNTIS